MGAVRRYWDIFRLVFVYIKFKYRQYRCKTNETVLVKTTYGPIRGVKRFSCWDDPFYSFEKIPFAKPPLGELRFKAPVAPEPWTEVKDCTKEGPNPLQTNIFIGRMEGSEDCLYLNVYTKNLHPQRPAPVMVWIYGGGFETGGTTKDFYSPDYIMQKEVVLVSITYRVGPFGFLSLNDSSLDIPGNAGLKDQLLGLKWVKANIAKFGGDPNNITLFGESAGAASTQYMMITDQAKDLFHKAILMSGSVLASWALVPARNWAYRLAKMVGYDGVNNDAKVFSYIKNASGSALLVGESKLLTKDERHNRIIFPFGPCIEPYVSSHCIIPEHPRLLLRKAWSAHIPIVIGCTSYEGLIFYRGFLSFKDPSLNIPGNAGLKDQLLGLKWVQANISEFGGDPNNVTIFGESAGAASCHYLMLTERSKGLFHRAILMSGSVLEPWARVSIENMTQRLAQHAGYIGNNTDQDMFEFYKEIDGVTLLHAERKILNREERKNCILLPIAPCIEPYVTEDCIISEDPKLLMRKTWSNEIPVIIGGTTDEGYLMQPFVRKSPQLLNVSDGFAYFLPLELDIDRHSEKAKELGLRIKNAHFGDQPVNNTTLKNFFDLYGYKLFWHGIHRTLLSRLQYGSAPTYLYKFDCDSPTFNHMRNFWCGPNVRGTCHADDLSYIFYNALSQDLPKDSMEYRVIQIMMTIFENFASNSDPNHSSLGVEWKPVQKDEKPAKCLNIREKTEIIDLPGQEKLEVWDSIYPLGTLI